LILRHTAPEAPARAQIIDLMQALKQSIEKAKPKQKAAPAERKRKTAWARKKALDNR
jgi:non-homologous end joining protein Ku